MNDQVLSREHIQGSGFGNVYVRHCELKIVKGLFGVTDFTVLVLFLLKLSSVAPGASETGFCNLSGAYYYNTHFIFSVSFQFW